MSLEKFIRHNTYIFAKIAIRNNNGLVSLREQARREPELNKGSGKKLYKKIARLQKFPHRNPYDREFGSSAL